MSLKILSIIALACLLLAAQPVRAADARGLDCSISSGRPQPGNMTGKVLTQEELFKQSYDEAECLRRAAAAAGAEWLETENLLRRSLQDSEGGHWDSAMALIEKARFEAEQALRQAEHEAEAWKRRVVE